jgi:ABC-type uncharacterized transport system, periplasmic component
MKSKYAHILFAGLIVLVLAAAILILNRHTTNGVKVGIIEPMAHMAISDITRGIQDGLIEDGNLEFIVEVKNANGDLSTVPQIIEQYKDTGVNIFVPIFTGSAQATKNTVGDKPIVFVAVTDPVAAGLLQNPKSPEGNVTGVSDLWPVGAQFALIRQILPEASRMGILFDPNDPNSESTMLLIREHAKASGFELLEKPVHSTTEVAEALPLFKGKVDCLFTANDVTVTKSFAALVAYAIENKIPLFAGDYSSVQRGAIAAVGQDYYDVGRTAAKMIVAISQGDQIANQPMQYTQGGDLHLNLAAAQKMGVNIPDIVRLKAKQTYETILEGDNK